MILHLTMTPRAGYDPRMDQAWQWLETILLWVLSTGLIMVCLGVTIVLFAGAYEVLEFVYETVQSAAVFLFG